MTKASTLLAVMAIATSPALAGPDARSDRESAPHEARVAPKAPPAPHATTAPPTTTAAPPAVAIGVAQPRLMPSGAPACGNVATRAPRPRECATPSASAPVLAARPAPAAPSVVARPAARQVQATTPRTASAPRRGGAR